MKHFDFIGLFLITTAVVCLLVGFTLSQTSWSSPATITLIALAPVIFAFGEVQFTRPGELDRLTSRALA